MAKRFFYVCAGLFLLALSQHLVTKTAGAQAGDEIAAVNGNSSLAISVNGLVFLTDDYLSGHWRLIGNVGVLSSRPIGIDSGGDYILITTYYGDTYRMSAAGGPATKIGNIFGSVATAATPSTWGNVKANYRK
jgi:hypothetical protein